ncbi:MAG: FAD-binding protein, partial [Nitrospinaceae bacterium]|nr:FAD-binding protein [Nitrospinaceae bacterium]
AGHRAAVLSRGGGTSLAGQTVGKAVVLDFSKYMNSVIEHDLDGEWARVQPGLVQDHFNDYLKPHGFVFGPNTSTSSRATLGGMMGNNSSGSESLVYGKTVDHVHEISGFLAGGEPFTFGPLEGAALQSKLEEKSRIGDIYRTLHRLSDENRQEIDDRYPKIMRRVAGYNLDELIKDEPFNLAKFLVGSEGTLATITEAKVRICRRPRARGSLAIHFDSVERALAASAQILTHKPAALEIMDRLLLGLAQQNIEARRWMTSFMEGDPEATLQVIFFGDGADEVRAKVEGLISELERDGIGYSRVPLLDAAGQAAISNVRKAGLGFLLGVKGDKKPYAFIEDCAVAPEKLLDYYRKLEKIIRDHDTQGSFYGHSSVGLMHIRPSINLKMESEVKKMVSIQEQTSDLVLEFGGAMSGEHGDGLARSHLVPKFFGNKLYNSFCEVKRTFDPEGLMNPGKIVNADAFTDNFRISPTYKTVPISTIMDFSADGGFARAIEMCNGVGACRKRDGTMCPSFQATNEEEHSTRGRANALREVISGGIEGEDLSSKRLYEVMELCLGCKGCKAECPSSVDMAKIKAEVMQAHWDRHGTPLGTRLFGRIAQINRLSKPFAALVNMGYKNTFLRSLMERFMGVDKRRELSPLVSETFEEWFRSRPSGVKSTRGKVLFMNDTFTNFHHPEVGKATIRVLEAAGFEVQLAEMGCCGRPLISNGLLREARDMAGENLIRLSGALREGAYIVGVEPSCLLTLRDEYPSLILGDDTRRLADSVFLLEEFLVHLKEKGELELPLRERPGRALFHGHCHQKSLVGSGPSLETLKLIPGLEVEEIPSGCCGMAGSFGYQKEHYDISLAIGEMKLFPAIRDEDAQTHVIANGVSCRQQIGHGTGRQARHLVEFLAEAIDD